LFEIIGILKTEKPDLTWSWGGLEATYGLLISYISGIKHINGSVRHGIVLKNRKHIWRKLMLQRSRYIVGNSKAGLDANGLKKGYILYNGLDEKFFTVSVEGSVESSIPEIKLSKEIITLISVANLVPFKDYTTILNSLEEINNRGTQFQYLIVGEGPERDRIEKEIELKNLSGKVYLLGRRENVNELLALSDLFIHSAKGEGCSNAVLEAMAAGLPVIATDTGGTSEIVKPSFGFLFEFGNAGQLTGHLELLMNNKPLIDEMKKNAREYASLHFSMERMMMDYHSIVEKVLKS